MLKRSKQKYQERPDVRLDRAGRNKANGILKRLGRLRKGDGKEAHHKDGNPRNNAESNLVARKRGPNRADKRDHGWIVSKAKHLMSKEGKSQKAAFAQAYSMEKERRA